MLEETLSIISAIITSSLFYWGLTRKSIPIPHFKRSPKKVYERPKASEYQSGKSYQRVPNYRKEIYPEPI